MEGSTMYVFGGRYDPQQPTLSNEIWSYSGQSWGNLTVSSGPEARQRAGLSAQGGRVFLYGGMGPTIANPTAVWVFDNTLSVPRWTQLPSTGRELP